MMDIFMQFILALFATLGFAVIFRVPVRRIPVCVTIGALGWITYLVTVYTIDSAVFGNFFGACMVGLCSTLAAIVFKDASTIFVIPGILCLVPGAKIFYTMEALLNGDIEEMAHVGIETLLMAGAIAMGLLVMGAITRVIRSLIRKTAQKTVDIKDRLKKGNRWEL